jgi:hypothetical protein
VAPSSRLISAQPMAAPYGRAQGFALSVEQSLIDEPLSRARSPAGDGSAGDRRRHADGKGRNRRGSATCREGKDGRPRGDPPGASGAALRDGAGAPTPGISLTDCVLQTPRNVLMRFGPGRLCFVAIYLVRTFASIYGLEATARRRRACLSAPPATPDGRSTSPLRTANPCIRSKFQATSNK